MIICDEDFVIEFRNGGFYGMATETEGRSVALNEASRFTTEEAARKEAGDWSLAGPMVRTVGYFKRKNADREQRGA